MTYEKAPRLEHLVELTMENCSIADISDHLLNNTPRLTSMNLSRNLITQLSSTHFSHSTHLRTLDLSHNPLQTLHGQVFRGSAIQRLLLRGTRLRSLYWVRELSSLHTLDISYSELLSLEGLLSTSLRTLRADGNRITTLTSASSAGTGGLHAPSLLLLSASHNHIERVDLQSNTRLLDVSLDGNHFRALSSDNFHLPASTQRLYLSHNRLLTHIAPHTLSSLHRLSLLDISDNRLAHVPTVPASVRTLHVHGNRLLCDCHVYAVWRRYYIGSTVTRPLTCEWRDTADTRQLSTLTPVYVLAHSWCGWPVATDSNHTHVWTQKGRGLVLRCRPNDQSQSPSRAVGGANVMWFLNGRVLRAAEYINQSERDWLNECCSQSNGRSLLSSKQPGEIYADFKYDITADGALSVHNTSGLPHYGNRFTCVTERAVQTINVVVGVSALQHVTYVAMIMAVVASVSAVVSALSVRLGLFIFHRCGHCTCLTHRPSPQARRLKEFLEYLEIWRAQQLGSLRDNYRQQMSAIKESCHVQMDKLRDSYRTQSKCLGDMRDYGAQQVEELSEQYVEQMRRIRDYSLHQMNRVQENYIFQRNRIRKFSNHQMVRLRHTYKYQQKTLVKLLENLPDLYLNNCRVTDEADDTQESEMIDVGGATTISCHGYAADGENMFLSGWPVGEMEMARRLETSEEQVAAAVTGLCEQTTSRVLRCPAGSRAECSDSVSVDWTERTKEDVYVTDRWRRKRRRGEEKEGQLYSSRQRNSSAEPCVSRNSDCEDVYVTDCVRAGRSRSVVALV